MRRNTIANVTLAAASLCVQPVISALAQPPGAQQPQTGQPGQPTRPDVTMPNDPMARERTMPGSNTSADTTPSKVDDRKFVKDAALGGMTEVELGKLAAQNGSSDAVKQFGQKMVDDHTKANERLKEVATGRSIEVPNALDSKHQSQVDKLSKLTGPEFDKAYIKNLVKDHQQDVRTFQAEAQMGSDPAVKNFASQTLPKLQEHLNMAKDLEGKTKSNKAKSSTTSSNTTPESSKQ